MCFELGHETERTDGVMAPGVVVGCVLLSGDQLLRVEQLAVRALPDLVDDARLEVDEDGPEVNIEKLRLLEIVLS